MKVKGIRILIFFCGFTLATKYANPQVVGLKPLEMPAKFVVPSVDVNLDISGEFRPGYLWIILSDRNDNLTFKDTLLTETFKTIGFLDPFYVIENKGELVRIVKDKELEDGKFSFLAEDYGWIEKSKMLIWQHCLVSPYAGENIKGLVQNTLTEVKQERVEQGVTYFYNPVLKSNSLKLSRSFEILYVYKDDGNVTLLGKTPSFYVEQAKENIFGWIKTTDITLWDHNLAVEVNWDKEAAKERQENEHPAIFYYDKPRAKRYGEGEKINIKLVFWDNDTYDKRPPGESWRFPLIGVDTASNVLKANVFNSTIKQGNILQTLVPKLSRFAGAFAPITIDGYNFPLFNIVFLLSKLELSKITKLNNELIQIVESNYDIKTKLYNFWHGKMDDVLRNDLRASTQTDSLTFNKICQLIYGVDGLSILSEYRLEQLIKPPYIPDFEINQYFDEVKEKQRELNEIFNANNYEYGFQSFDIYYYWIDRRLFPL